MRVQASCPQKSNPLPSKEETPPVFTLRLRLPLYHAFITNTATLSSDFFEKGRCQGTRGHLQTDSSATLLLLSGARISYNTTLVTSTCTVQLQRPLGSELLGVFLPDAAFFHPEAGSTLLTSWQWQTVGTSTWLPSKESWAAPDARYYHSFKN